MRVSVRVRKRNKLQVADMYLSMKLPLRVLRLIQFHKSSELGKLFVCKSGIVRPVRSVFEVGCGSFDDVYFKVSY